MDVKVVLEGTKQAGLPNVIPRDIVIGKPTVRKIIALTGPRRAGKTYMLYQLAKESGSWYFISIEDERLEQSSSLLGEACAYTSGKSKNIFIDEIDKAEKWDIALRRVSEDYKELSFFVSSSSAKLSYQLLPSPLRGRVISYEILPLSFKEFLRFKDIPAGLFDERTVSRIKEALDEYLLFGGFPEVVLEENNTQKAYLLNSYFETIVTQDVAEQFDLDHRLVKYAAKTLRKHTFYSASKMFDLFKTAGFKVGKETTLKLEDCFSQAYYAAFVEIFSRKAKDTLQYPRKPYLFDTGFLAFGIPENEWRLYENAVYLSLRRKKRIDEEINYWKSEDGYEVDFVVREGEKAIQLIQVCYSIEDEQTKKRELRSLVKAAKVFGLGNGLIINKDTKSTEIVDGIRIDYIPLWEFLLS